MPSDISHEERIFEAARLVKDAAARRSFLALECADDPQLLARVQQLLEADRDADRFFQESASSIANSALLLNITEQPGDRIGRYRLLEQIGEGGAGVVYMAEQEHPVRRRVALKIIKLGMDTRSVIARFDAERQALALMDHPNIAKVFDGGATETGRPFFVMELVRGLKITEFCAQNDLSINERLELFILVCQAVQHAHQKGIIHRDLKPSNILVTLNDGESVPKVIDFGIAKATEGRLTDATLFTSFSQMLGTPAYMSPEQALMTSVDIDTRADIYSLGVLLYELLTGNTPFDTQAMLMSGLDALRKTICEQEPEWPSTRLARINAHPRMSNPQRVTEVQGDLDWIVMKCLEKDRARRYQTANALAMDVRRFLNNEPIIARPAGRIYQAQKFIKRNKLAVSAAAAIVLTVLVGSMLTTREALRAQRAEKEQLAHKLRAEAEAEHALKAESEMRAKLWQSYLTEAIALRNSRRPGRRFTALDLLAKAADIRASTALRNAAIAAMPLPDIKLQEEVDTTPSYLGFVRVDAACKRLALVDQSSAIIVRNIREAANVAVFPCPGTKVVNLSFSPDGTLVAASMATKTGFILRVFDVPARQFLGETPVGTHDFSFFPDNVRLMFVAPDKTLRARNVRQFANNEISLLDDKVEAVALSHDGKKVAYCVGGKSEIHFWSLDGEQATPTLISKSPVDGLTWSEDGTCLAATSPDHRLYLWDTVKGAMWGPLVGHQSHPVSAAFSHNGQILASTGWDGMLRLWNVPTASEFCRRATFSYSAWFAPGDDSFLMMTAENKLSIFDLAVGRECRTLRYSENGSIESWSCAFTPDGKTLLTPHGNGIRRWDVDRGSDLGLYDVGLTRTILTSTSGDNLVTVGNAGVHRWKLDGSTELILSKHDEFVPWRPDFMTLATCDAAGESLCGVRAGKACVFNLNEKRETATFEAAYGFDFAVLSPAQNLVAAGSWTKGLTIYNVADRSIVTNIPTSANGAAFSLDGTLLAIAGYKEYSILDTETWNTLWRLPRSETGFYIRGAFAFSFDSRMIALSQGPLVMLCDSATGRELATFEAPEEANISALAFTRDTRMLAVCKWNRTVDLWDLGLIRQQLAAIKLDWK